MIFVRGRIDGVLFFVNGNNGDQRDGNESAKHQEAGIDEKDAAEDDELNVGGNDGVSTFFGGNAKSAKDNRSGGNDETEDDGRDSFLNRFIAEAVDDQERGIGGQDGADDDHHEWDKPDQDEHKLTRFLSYDKPNADGESEARGNRGSRKAGFRKGRAQKPTDDPQRSDDDEGPAKNEGDALDRFSRAVSVHQGVHARVAHLSTGDNHQDANNENQHGFDPVGQ